MIGGLCVIIRRSFVGCEVWGGLESRGVKGWACHQGNRISFPFLVSFCIPFYNMYFKGFQVSNCYCFSFYPPLMFIFSWFNMPSWWLDCRDGREPTGQAKKKRIMFVIVFTSHIFKGLLKVKWGKWDVVVISPKPKVNRGGGGGVCVDFLDKIYTPWYWKLWLLHSTWEHKVWELKRLGPRQHSRSKRKWEGIVFTDACIGSVCPILSYY